MSVTQNMLAMYRSPRKVVDRLLGMGEREDRAFAILMASCVVVFIGQWPRLARQAYLSGEDLNLLLGGTLMAWLFLAPLLAYSLALLSHFILRILGRKQTAYGARLALFWAMLAASPLILLHGLVAGFIGPGPGLTIVGFVWFVLFLWFWFSGLFEAGRTNS